MEKIYIPLIDKSYFLLFPLVLYFNRIDQEYIQFIDNNVVARDLHECIQKGKRIINQKNNGFNFWVQFLRNFVV